MLPGRFEPATCCTAKNVAQERTDRQMPSCKQTRTRGCSPLFLIVNSSPTSPAILHAPRANSTARGRSIALKTVSDSATNTLFMSAGPWAVQCWNCRQCGTLREVFGDLASFQKALPENSPNHNMMPPKDLLFVANLECWI